MNNYQKLDLISACKKYENKSHLIHFWAKYTGNPVSSFREEFWLTFIVPNMIEILSECYPFDKFIRTVKDSCLGEIDKESTIYFWEVHILNLPMSDYKRYS